MILDLTTGLFHAAELYLALQVAAGLMTPEFLAGRIAQWVRTGLTVAAQA